MTNATAGQADSAPPDEPPRPHVWVDADATPRPVREILLRAAERRGVALTFVANAPQRTPRKLTHVTSVQVAGGLDAADEYIAERCVEGELVITADVPLAVAANEAGAIALDPRGQLLDESTIGERSAVRDLMMGLRDTLHEQIGGPRAYSQVDRREFASAFDRWLTKALRRAGR